MERSMSMRWNTYVIHLDFSYHSDFWDAPLILPLTSLLMQVATHTRPEGHFKVQATIFFQGPLPPTGLK